MALIPRWTWGDVDLSDSPFLFSFGSDFGAPQTPTDALAQLLLDGEIEVSSRASNRTIEFSVYVESTDLLAAADAERLLALEADKARNTFTFDPGDGYGVPTVFETYRAQLSFVRSDDGEQSGLRRYDVSMKAYPFGHSVNAVETAAIDSGGSAPSVPTITTINAGTATTGWSAASGTLTVDAGQLLAGNAVAITYTPAAPVDLTGTRYVSLVMSRRVLVSPGVYATSNLTVNPTLKVNGVAAEFVQVTSETASSSRYYWRVPASTTASKFTVTTAEPGTVPGVRFSSLKRQDILASYGTTRQKQRTLEVAGSARTQGSLAVEHATSALGSALVYTWPADDGRAYSPPLRPYRTSGAVTPDAATVSGARDLLDSPLVYDVPVASLVNGTHLLIARVRSDTDGDQSVNYSAQLRQGVTNVGAATSGTTVVPFASTPTAWRIVVLARLMLPPTSVPSNSSAVVRVTIAATSAGASNIDLDEAWLFNTSVGDLSWVECGTASPSVGGSSNRLWLNAATTDVPHPTIYRGYAADASDAAFPAATEVPAFGTHRFTPPLMNVFTVTSNALDAAVSLQHYPAWHTHAAS